MERLSEAHPRMISVQLAASHPYQAQLAAKASYSVELYPLPSSCLVKLLERYRWREVTRRVEAWWATEPCTHQQPGRAAYIQRLPRELVLPSRMSRWCTRCLARWIGLAFFEAW